MQMKSFMYSCMVKCSTVCPVNILLQMANITQQVVATMCVQALPTLCSYSGETGGLSNYSLV